MTSATHLQLPDDRHAVLLQALHVMVEQHGDTWFAQGIEIDYAASGTSLADVQARFERGLRRTIQANVERFNSIDRLLKYAPAEVREAFNASATRFRVTHFSVFDAGDGIPGSFPFHHLVFAERAQPAVC